MSFNIRRFEARFEGDVSEKFQKLFPGPFNGFPYSLNVLALPAGNLTEGYPFGQHQQPAPLYLRKLLKRLFDPLVFKLPEKFHLWSTAVRIILTFIFRRIQGIAMVPLLPVLIAFLPPGIQNQVSDFLIDLYI